MMWAHVWFPRAHPRTRPHTVRQSIILLKKMPFVYACNFAKNEKNKKFLFQKH